MSLKAFHIFFVVVTVLTSGALGAWSWGQYQTKATPTYLALSVGCGVLVVVMLAYGVWFLKKIRQLNGS